MPKGYLFCEKKQGKPHTEEWNKKISKSNKGKISPFKGKPLSEETKKKISESTKGKKRVQSLLFVLKQVLFINHQRKLRDN